MTHLTLLYQLLCDTVPSMPTNGVVTQMRKGLLEYCVLSLLLAEPRYGYELVQLLGEFDGMLTTEGTIYPLLTRLERDGVVRTEWRLESGRPRKYYSPTASGRAALRTFKTEWQLLKTSVDSIMSRRERQ